MKNLIILFSFLILLFPAISAVEINMNSAEVLQGETVIVSISGNFLDAITEDNVYFYREHTRTSFDYDIARINDVYYIYFQTVNKAVNNYSINISGIRYMAGSQVSDAQISKAFSIINETSDFSVDPGFIIADEDFFIKIQNFQSSSITINLDTEIISGMQNETFGFMFNNEEVESSITLSSGESKNLYFQIENISETTIGEIVLDSGSTEYAVPFYVLVKDSPVSNESNISNEEINETGSLNETISNESSSTEGNCSFFGSLFGTCDATDNEEEEEEEEIEENNSTENSSEVDYEVVKVGNKTVAIKDGEILNESATSKTCSEIKGVVCSSGEVCQNTTVYAKDAKCCVSKCVVEEKSTSNSKTIGWIIIAFIFIMILWFFVKKFRGMKNKKDPLLNSAKKL
jgi:hypothetical protein